MTIRLPRIRSGSCRSNLGGAVRMALPVAWRKPQWPQYVRRGHLCPSINARFLHAGLRARGWLSSYAASWHTDDVASGVVEARVCSPPTSFTCSPSRPLTHQVATAPGLPMAELRARLARTWLFDGKFRHRYARGVVRPTVLFVSHITAEAAEDHGEL
jgi:hypothetical protein